jgi:hypothetical protein
VKDIGLGVLLDQLCTEIVRRRVERGAKLLVHPQVYRCVAESRPQEVARGVPLMLLGLELQVSDDVSPASFRIMR